MLRFAQHRSQQAKFNKLFEVNIRNVETSELCASFAIYNYKMFAKFKIFNAELKPESIEDTSHSIFIGQKHLSRNFKI